MGFQNAVQVLIWVSYAAIEQLRKAMFHLAIEHNYIVLRPLAIGTQSPQ
jgi:hypothetical protein